MDFEKPKHSSDQNPTPLHDGGLPDPPSHQDYIRDSISSTKGERAKYPLEPQNDSTPEPSTRKDDSFGNPRPPQDDIVPDPQVHSLENPMSSQNDTVQNPLSPEDERGPDMLTCQKNSIVKGSSSIPERNVPRNINCGLINRTISFVTVIVVFIVFVGWTWNYANSPPCLSIWTRPMCPPIVSREEWGARQPKSRENLTTPVALVIIHHTYKPPACYSLEACKKAMVEMQNFHMDTRGWDDIGYNFAIGYEYVLMGRGWQTVGAHAKGFNNVSIGISLIGDYTEKLPTPPMLSLVKELIQCGIDNNYIVADYKLIGHRQVRDTECPGQAFYDVIQTWDHWGPMETDQPCNVTKPLGDL